MGLFGKKDKDQDRDLDRIREGEDQETLELREEELRAEKERIQAGEVRLRKHVVEENQTIEVPVTREEVVVERHSVEGRRAADGDIGDEDEIRIPLMEEEVRVEKTPVVREEVSLRKQQVHDTERVSDTVKREEARIESSGEAKVRTGSTGKTWQGRERRRRGNSSYQGVERRVSAL